MFERFSYFSSVCYVLSNMLMEHGSLRVFTTCQRKKQWGESSMFHILNSTIISSLFFFFLFFSIALTGKCFCERALVFVKWMSKKAFCPCLHSPRALICLVLHCHQLNHLTLHFQSFVVLVQFQHHINLFLVDLLQNL